MNYWKCKACIKILKKVADVEIEGVNREVIVIDDASTDESLKYLKGFEKYIKIYRLSLIHI